MNDIDRFVLCLSQIAESNPNTINEANQLLNELRASNIILYLTLAANVAKSNDINDQLILLSLSAIKDTCTPKRITPLSLIREVWFDASGSEMTSLVREAIVKNINSNTISIRSIACASLASVLLIDSFKLKDIRKAALKAYWMDILNKIVSFTSNTDPFNIGSMLVFNEIFYLNIIPNEIPIDCFDKQIYISLIKVIFNQLENLNFDQDLKIKSLECLKNLIKIGSLNLFSYDMVVKIFSIIRIILPTATTNLYRQVHFLLKEIIKSFYSQYSAFIDEIYDITRLGIECPNLELKTISYHFWSHIWAFEKRYINNEKEGFHNILGKYAQNLIQYGFIFLYNLDPESKLEINDQDYPISEYIILTLRSIFDNLILTGEMDNNFVFIANCINKFLNEDTQNGKYASIKILQALTYDHGNVFIFDFIQSKLAEIEQIALYNNVSLVKSSLQLFRYVVDFNEKILTETIFFDELLRIVAKCFLSPSIDIIKADLALTSAICSKAPPYMINSHFDDIYSLIASKFNDSDLNSDSITSPAYITMEYFIRACSKETFPKIILFLDALISTFKENFSNTFAPNFESNQISILHLINEILIKLGENSGEKVKVVAEMLFAIINNRSIGIYGELITIFKTIISIMKNDFLIYAQQFISTINIAFSSQNLQLISISAECFGEFCFILKERSHRFISNEIISIFQIAQQFVDSEQFDVIPILMASLARILTGIPSFIPIEFINTLWNYGFKLINIRINTNIIEDIEFATKLYCSLCRLYSAIIKIIPQEISNKPMFINDTKRKLFPLFGYIRSLESDDIELLHSAFTLLRDIGKKLQNKINTQFHSKIVQDLFQFVIKQFSADEKYRWFLQETLEIFNEINEY